MILWAIVPEIKLSYLILLAYETCVSAAVVPLRRVGVIDRHLSRNESSSCEL